MELSSLSLNNLSEAATRSVLLYYVFIIMAVKIILPAETSQYANYSGDNFSESLKWRHYQTLRLLVASGLTSHVLDGAVQHQVQQRIKTFQDTAGWKGNPQH